MPFPLSQAQLLRMLERLHDVVPEKQIALKGRLQHFQRLSFPAGVNTGRGKPAAYGASEIVWILLAFELLQLGMTPERITRVLGQIPLVVLDAAAYGAKNLERADPDDCRRDGEPYEDRLGYHFILFDPGALSNLSTSEASGDLALRTIHGTLGHRLQERIFESGGRLAVVDSTFLIARASLFLRDEIGISCREFAEELRQWASSMKWEPVVDEHP